MRDKLIEILDNNATCIELGMESCDTCQYGRVEDCYTHALVDHLIANDVVPVVRCKDCKHFNNWCIMTDDGTAPDDFCSYGERKENG